MDLASVYVPVTIDVVISGMRPIKKRLKNYQDIFDCNQKCTRHILSGSPGQGKSTFCAKVAYDWCHRSAKSSLLKHIRLLFILPLSILDHTSNIEEAIMSHLLSETDDVDSDTLGKIIKHLGTSVVIVLDGMDEAPPDLFTKPEIGNLMMLIRYKYLRKCRVLITTRPWREREITSIASYRRLELQKMNKRDVKAYVRKLFQQNPTDLRAMALGTDLQRYIDDNRLLVDTYTPLVVLLICWFWMETNGGEEIPHRIGELYEKIVDVMYRSVPHSTINKVSYLSSLFSIILLKFQL